VFMCVAYSIAKYGMSLCVLGMSEELKADGIAVNALWPKTGIVYNFLQFSAICTFVCLSTVCVFSTIK